MSGAGFRPGGRLAAGLGPVARRDFLAAAAGVKIAVENHAGDMTSRELAGLVAEAGPGSSA